MRFDLPREIGLQVFDLRHVRRKARRLVLERHVDDREIAAAAGDDGRCARLPDGAAAACFGRRVARRAL